MSYSQLFLNRLAIELNKCFDDKVLKMLQSDVDPIIKVNNLVTMGAIIDWGFRDVHSGPDNDIHWESILTIHTVDGRTITFTGALLKKKRDSQRDAARMYIDYLLTGCVHLHNQGLDDEPKSNGVTQVSTGHRITFKKFLDLVSRIYDQFFVLEQEGQYFHSRQIATSEGIYDPINVPIECIFYRVMNGDIFCSIYNGEVLWSRNPKYEDTLKKLPNQIVMTTSEVKRLCDMAAEVIKQERFLFESIFPDTIATMSAKKRPIVFCIPSYHLSEAKNSMDMNYFYTDSERLFDGLMKFAHSLPLNDKVCIAMWRSNYYYSWNNVGLLPDEIKGEVDYARITFSADKNSETPGFKMWKDSVSLEATGVIKEKVEKKVDDLKNSKHACEYHYANEGALYFDVASVGRVYIKNVYENVWDFIPKCDCKSTKIDLKDWNGLFRDPRANIVDDILKSYSNRELMVIIYLINAFSENYSKEYLGGHLIPLSEAREHWNNDSVIRNAMKEHNVIWERRRMTPFSTNFFTHYFQRFSTHMYRSGWTDQKFLDETSKQEDGSLLFFVLSIIGIICCYATLGFLPAAFITQPALMISLISSYFTGYTGVFWAAFKGAKTKAREKTLYLVFAVLSLNIVIFSYLAFKKLFTTVKSVIVNQADGQPLFTARATSGFLYIIKGTVGIVVRILWMSGKKLPANWRMLEKDFKYATDDLLNLVRGYQLLRGDKLFMDNLDKVINQANGDQPFADHGGSESDTDATKDIDLGLSLDELADKEWNLSRDDVYRFVKDNKYIIMGIVGCGLLISGVIYFLLREKKEEIDGVVNEGWQRKQFDKNHFVANPADYVTRGDPRTAEQKALTEAVTKKLMMKPVPKELIKFSEVRPSSDITPLLNYGEVLVRLGGHERRFTPASEGTKAQVAKYIKDAENTARAFGKIVYVGVRKQADTGKHDWYGLKPIKQEALDIDDVSLDVVASSYNLSLTDAERKIVKDSLSINEGLAKVVVLRGMDCTIENNGLVDGGYLTVAADMRNESMLGSQKLRLSDVLGSVYSIHNATYKTRSLAFFVRGQMYTIAHGVCDKDLTTRNPGTFDKCVRDENFFLDCGKLKVKRLDVAADVAILTYHGENPKQCHINEEMGEYQGIGFIVSKRGSVDSPVPFIAIGMIWKAATYLMHTIPTEDGDSGAPIFTAIGHLVGIHKGHISTLNVGVPIDAFVDAKVRPQFAKILDQFYNQAIGDSIGNNINFDYLPPYLRPKIMPVPDDSCVPLEYREAHNNGNCRIIGSVLQKSRTYDKFHIHELYTTFAEKFGLPKRVEESQWGIAHPSLNSIRKDFFKYCSKRNFPYDYVRFRQALNYYEEWFQKKYPSKIPPMDAMASIESFDGSKAASFPLNLVYATKGQFRDREILAFFMFLEMIEKGEDPSVIFEEFGKEELRLVIKLMEDKIRSVNSAPYMVVFVERMLFGNLLEITANMPFQESYTTCGFSPYYGGWDELVKFIKSKRYSYDKMDFVKWDSSIQLFIAIPVLNTWFNQIEASTIHYKLFDWYLRHVWYECICLLPIKDLGNGQTLCLLVIIYRGMKSGLLITFLGNCHINIVRHIYCMLTYEGKVMIAYEAPVEVRKLLLGDEKEPVGACGDDFAFGSSFLIDIDDYKKHNSDLGLELEDIRVTEGFEFEFAGAETVIFGNYFVPVYNQERLLFNVAVAKKNMLSWQYCNKLDALVRVGAFANVDMMNQIVQYRNHLVRNLVNVDPEVQKHAPSYVSIKEARQNFLVINEAAALNIIEPHKFGEGFCPTQEDLNSDLSSIIMRYHGNYCGPNWSAGKTQESVIDPTVPAVDEFDQICLEHDKAFAQYREGEITEEELGEANNLFFDQNWFQGIKRTLAALAVKFGGLSMARRKGGKKVRNVIKKAEKKIARKLVAVNGSSIGKRLPRSLRRPRGRRPFNRRRQAMNFKSGPAYVARQTKISRNRYTLKQGPDSATMEGSFFITNMTAGANGYKAGDIIYSNSINPFNFGQSDVEYEANRWERFIFKNFSFHFETQAPTNTPGGIILYADYDPVDAIPNGQNGIFQALNSRVATAGAIWKDHTISVKKKPMQTWYYCQEETNDNDTSYRRFTQQGTVSVLAQSDIPANTVMGALLVKFTIMFQGRHLDPSSTITNATTLQSGGSFSTTNVFGSAPVASALNDNSITFLGGTPAIYQLIAAPGTYKVVVAIGGSGMNTTAISFGDFVGCTMSNDTVAYTTTADVLYLTLNNIAGTCKFSVTVTGGTTSGWTGSKMTIYRVRSSVFKYERQQIKDKDDALMKKRVEELEQKLMMLLSGDNNISAPAKSVSGTSTPRLSTF